MKKLLLILLLCGCSTLVQPIRHLGKTKIEFTEPIPENDAKAAIKNTIRTIFFWEDYFRITSRKINILITPRLNFKCGKVTAIGCWDEKNKVAKVTMGRYNHVPALFHELCHANFAPYDVYHLNSNWPEWIEKQAEINERLINEY